MDSQALDVIKQRSKSIFLKLGDIFNSLVEFVFNEINSLKRCIVEALIMNLSNSRNASELLSKTKLSLNIQILLIQTVFKVHCYFGSCII